MKILVLVQDYPSSGSPYSMAYVHTRCLGYRKLGLGVVVLSFNAKSPYVFEGVEVRPEAAIEWKEFDCIVSHAPNLRNHVRFLRRTERKKVALFFHGHEVLRRKEYPAPYPWNKQRPLKSIATSVYDAIKLKALKIWISRLSRENKIGLIFVSKWMEDRFDANINIEAQNSKISRIVIPNAVNEVFLIKTYDQDAEKIADFVTIRPLDDSKYSIDIVTQLAATNPSKTFHVYGVGEYFRRNKAPRNLTWFDTFIGQSEIPSLLDRYRYALMPTRFDAQGVMVCEMATYGIPTLTSDIEVCKEMLDGFSNCDFVLSSATALPEGLAKLQPAARKNRKFDLRDLVQKEIDFINDL